MKKYGCIGKKLSHSFSKEIHALLADYEYELIELSEVFEFSRLKKFRLITLPSIERFLIPAVITASGFAWKAEIAAEIIAYTKNSIGQGINDAKYYMDTPTIFAWTVVIIALSISLEAITAYVMRRVKNES